MTIVGFTTIQIKKACDLARKHGAENVTVLVTMIGGQRPTRSACSLPPRTGRRTARSRSRSWTTLKCWPSCKKLARSPHGRRM